MIILKCPYCKAEYVSTFKETVMYMKSMRPIVKCRCNRIFEIIDDCGEISTKRI